MRAVVDTNVIAYLLLGTQEFVSEAQIFWSLAAAPMAPSLWEAELTNVIWMAARAKVLSKDAAPAKLDYAARLGIQSVSNRTLWRGALRRSLETGAAAYDTLFVELAVREDSPLATFDKRVLKSFPGIAICPRDAV